MRFKTDKWGFFHDGEAYEVCVSGVSGAAVGYDIFQDGEQVSTAKHYELAPLVEDEFGEPMSNVSAEDYRGGDA